jgi:nucleotide-binding universal stress UspA family protein
MPNSILAPLDGSPAAESGLRWAEHAAGCCGVAIDLFTVVEPAAACANGDMTRAEEYLRTRKNDIQASGLTVDFELVTGSPPERILLRANGADLTVMTYGTSRWLIGGALDFVLQNMARPLVVVRAHPRQTPSVPKTQKILVPLDTAPYSGDALPEARRLARAFGASLVLCHVVAPVGPYMESARAPSGVRRIIEDRLAQARSYLSGVATNVEREGTPVETVVDMGERSRQIMRIAEQCQAGMIAMATRGTRTLTRVMGSVAYGVLQLGYLPCLLVRPIESD